MTLEADIATVLKTQCAQTFPDFAPVGTLPPWTTYQYIGGRALRWLDGSAADKRNTLVQISVWTTERLQTITLIRAIEDALCVASAFRAKPLSEPISDVDETLGFYGSAQDFEVYSTR